ncbi:MAG: TCR/Tet family MFS transporter [Crocinitomicaceae bacterium]
MKSSKNASIIFIFITVMVDMIGIGIIFPVMPDLIKNITGGTIGEASFYSGILATTYAVLQFIFAPILGELSDKYGRKPVLLIALFGLGIDYLFFAFAPTLIWLFIGRVIAGIAGASHTVASAYIADISSKEDKAKNFGIMGAAFGLGFIIGPTIGGLFSELGVHVPFFVAAGITLLNFLFGLFFVPESLNTENRREIDYQRMIPGKSLLRLTSYPFGSLLLVFFLVSLAGMALPLTWAYFTIESYSWTRIEVGVSLSIIGLLVAIVQAGLIRWFQKKFGTKKTILIGLSLLTIGMLLFAIAFNETLLYLFLIPYALGGITGPTIQGVISNNVSDKEQGNLQGVITSLTSISTIISPLIYPIIFYSFTKEGNTYFPGAPYLVAGIILLIAVILAIKSIDKVKIT